MRLEKYGIKSFIRLNAAITELGKAEADYERAGGIITLIPELAMIVVLC